MLPFVYYFTTVFFLSLFHILFILYIFHKLTQFFYVLASSYLWCSVFAGLVRMWFQGLILDGRTVIAYMYAIMFCFHFQVFYKRTGSYYMLTLCRIHALLFMQKLSNHCSLLIKVYGELEMCS